MSLRKRQKGKRRWKIGDRPWRTYPWSITTANMDAAAITSAKLTTQELIWSPAVRPASSEEATRHGARSDLELRQGGPLKPGGSTIV